MILIYTIFAIQVKSMKYLLLIIFILSVIFSAISQNPDKKTFATRTDHPPRIDGQLNDEVWAKATVISDFKQYSPFHNTTATQKMEVRILYDNKAVYVGAFMFDTAPDSILKQLGNRDDDDLNADFFGIEFDTYNKQEDAYSFSVTASGVQCDSRENDLTYNAVWESSVKINEKGWCAEFRIPYSAIRFPKKDTLTWGLEIYRTIRRKREIDQWAMESNTSKNNLIYWGKLYGISHIEAPIRLSLTPYLTLYGEHFPYNISGNSNFSKGIMGGMDLKYGLNESFTLDLTLLPDFSQVQSDNIVKNISAFETVYDENRPFFTEAVDLFQKGGLLYSRRIGKTPALHDDVAYFLKDGEHLKKNQAQTNLLNAVKLSGRNKNGLAVGLFNAITGDTYALIEDSLGNSRKMLTEPFANYNIVVFDKQMKHNNSFYIVNTNVSRRAKIGDANVSGCGLKLLDQSNTYQVDLTGSLSYLYHSRYDSIFGERENANGYKYQLKLSKIQGHFRFDLWREIINSKYNNNDMGITLRNNHTDNNLSLEYVKYEPFSVFMWMENALSINVKTNYQTGLIADNLCAYKHVSTFINYLTVWGCFYITIAEKHDYYESRVPGRYLIVPNYYGYYVGSSSDYRNPFALDLNFEHTHAEAEDYDDYSVSIEPIFRLSDRFTLNYSILYKLFTNSRNYVEVDTAGKIIFGNMDMTTITNSLSSRYMFRNDLSLSLRLRHYWSKAEFDKFYFLNEEGRLDDDPAFIGNRNFNFNAFNIDLVFNWQFAPGSSLNIIWKNSILNEGDIVINRFFENIDKTFDSPQLNSLAIKVLYYLDYQYLRRMR